MYVCVCAVGFKISTEDKKGFEGQSRCVPAWRQLEKDKVRRLSELAKAQTHAEMNFKKDRNFLFKRCRLQWLASRRRMIKINFINKNMRQSENETVTAYLPITRTKISYKNIYFMIVSPK